MDILNNRYRIIEEFPQETKNLHCFLVEDLWNLELPWFELKMVKAPSIEAAFMDFLRDKFFLIKKIDCSLFLPIYDFTRLFNIDGTAVSEDLYIYTHEYIKNKVLLLEFLKTASAEEILSIIIFICRGLNYICNYGLECIDFKLDNIYVMRENKKMYLRIKDVITLKLNDSMEIIGSDNAAVEKFEYAPNVLKNIFLSVLKGQDLKNIDDGRYKAIKARYFLSDISDADKKIFTCLFNICDKLYQYERKKRNYLFYQIIQDINKELNTEFFIGCGLAYNENMIELKPIGRYADKKQLRSYFYDLQNNKPQNNIFFITAQLGSGKTNFLTELNFLFLLEKCNVFYIPSLDGFDEEQFFLHIMRNVLLNFSSSENNLSEREIQEGIAFITAENQSADKMDMIKYKLVNRISNLLLEKKSPEMTIFIVDDIHLASNFILDILLYLAIESVHHKKVMLIFSYDEFGISQNAYAQRFVDILINQNTTKKINLSNLTEDETGLLIRYLMDVRRVPELLIKKIYSHTSGNPLFVTEILKELIYNGDVKKDKITDVCELSSNMLDSSFSIQISPNIEQAIENHIKNLSTEERSLLNAMSVFQNTFTFDEILRVINLNKKVVEKYFFKFLENNIITEIESTHIQEYSIVNKILQRTLYSQIDFLYKVEIHKKIMGLIKENSELAVMEFIWHAEGADLLEEAVEYCIKNEPVIKKIYSPNAYISIFEKIYTFITDDNVDTQLYVLLLIMDIYLDIENVFECINKILQAETLLQKGVSDNSLLALLYITKINYEILINSDVKLIAKILQSAEETVKKLEDKFVYLSLLKAKTKFLQYSNRYSECIETAKELIALCGNSINTQSLKAAALLELGKGYYFSERYELAEKTYLEAIKIASKVSNFKVKNAAYNNLAIIYGNIRHDFYLALKYYDSAINGNESYSNISVQVLAMLNSCIINAFLGNYLDAYNMCLSAIKKIKQNQLYNRYLFAYTLLYEFLLLFGKYDAASACKLRIENLLNDIRIPQRISYKNSYTQESAKLAAAFGEYNNEKILLERTLATDAFTFEIRKIFLEASLEINKLISGEKDDISILEAYYTQMFCSKYAKTLYVVFYNILESLSQLVVMRRDIDFSPILKYIAKTDISIYSDTLHGIVNFLLSFFDKENAEQYLLKANLQHSINLNHTININTELALLYLSQGNIDLSAVKFIEVQKSICLIMKSIPNEKQLAFFNAHNYGLAFIVVKDCLEKKLKSNYLNYKKNFTFQEMQRALATDFVTIFKNNPGFMNSIVTKLKNTTKFKNKTLDDVIKKFSNNFLKNIKTLLEFAEINLLATDSHIFIVDSDNNINPLFKFGKNKIIEKIVQLLKNSNYDIEGVSKYQALPANIIVPIYPLNYDNAETDVIAYIIFVSNRDINTCTEVEFNLCRSLKNIFTFLIESYKLQQDASTDKLTSALTRKYTETALNELFLLSKQTGKPFSILMYDLDHFKIINDTYGHQLGDVVLKGIAAATMQVLHHEQILGRFGGEEFIILLPELNAKEAYVIAEKIRKQVELLTFDNRDVKITVSIGVVSYPQHAATPYDLLLKVDQALYNAKNSGRNSVCIWQEGLAYTEKKADRLAGIITGHSSIDVKNSLLFNEITASIRKNMTKSERLTFCLAKIKEVMAVDTALIIPVKGCKAAANILKVPSHEDSGFKLNNAFIKNVINSKTGMFQIDWDNIAGKNKMTGIPTWNSVLITPVIYGEKVKALLYLISSIRGKEFSANDLNMANFLASCIAAFF